MKYFILISVLVAVTLAEENDVHGQAAAHKTCQDAPETHVDESIFEKLKKHEKVDLPENFGKHMLCMAKGLSLINEEGKVNIEGVKTHVQHVITDAHAVEEIVKKCSVDKETPEITAKELYKCLGKHHVMGGGHHHGHKHGNHSSEESNESHSNESHDHSHHGHH